MWTCEGEKPRTTVVRGIMMEDRWESASEGWSDSLDGDWDSVVVEPDRSRVAAGRGISLRGATEGFAVVGAERGALSLTMDTIIFSKSSELMWRSRLLRLLMEESWRRILGRAISRGAETEVNSTASSSASESTLPDSWGTSSSLLESVGMFWGEVGMGLMVAEVTSLSSFSMSCSLCQSLQLRFSSLRPCSTESAQREKTVGDVLADGRVAGEAEDLTSPHAIQVGRVGGVNLVNHVGVHGQDGRV
jgi:hypothetical protein